MEATRPPSPRPDRIHPSALTAPGSSRRSSRSSQSVKACPVRRGVTRTAADDLRTMRLCQRLGSDEPPALERAVAQVKAHPPRQVATVELTPPAGDWASASRTYLGTYLPSTLTWVRARFSAR